MLWNQVLDLATQTGRHRWTRADAWRAMVCQVDIDRPWCVYTVDWTHEGLADVLACLEFRDRVHSKLSKPPCQTPSDYPTAPE